MKKEQKKEAFKEFLASNEVLVVDKSSASRRRLTKTIVDMGGKRQQVHSVAHFSEAVEIIEKHKPKLVLSDFSINGGSGFDLFKEYRSRHPDEKKATLILITSNISQSAVAKAAEEDVDSFIIKPYTVQSLEKSLVNAVINKLHPSEYIVTIERGKEKLFAGEYEEAMAIFDEAIALNKKPSLAHFYHGQAKYFLESMEEAGDDYKKGLAINNIHFKCQVGLYELFMKEDKYFEAYEVVKNIAKYFPANPDRLKEVIRLAIITKNYQDIDDYYNIFVDLDERTDDVVNYVCSGMYVYGKYAFQQKDKKKGKEIFEKVGISCAGMTKFLRAMVAELTDWGIFDDAQRLISRFPAGMNDSYDYMVANFLADSNGMSNAEKMNGALEVYNAGHKDYHVMMALIKAMKAEGHAEKAQDYEYEAKKLWPDKFGGGQEPQAA
jgi:CheY-like chemotaxis protein